MSLIADALKRAQEQRSEGKGDGGRDDRARRMISGSGPVRVETGRRLTVPRSVAIAGTVLAAAVVTFGAVVWLAPRAEGGSGETGVVASSEGVARGPTGGSGDGATGSIADSVGVRGEARGREGGAGASAGSGESGVDPGGEVGGEAGPGGGTGVAGARTAAGTDAGTDARTGTPGASTPPAGADEAASFTLRLEGGAMGSGSGASGDGDAGASDASELFGRALSAHQRGDLRGAAALYRRAIERNPGDAQLHNNLGAVYRALSMPGEALSAFRRAVEVEPSYAPAWSNLGLMLDATGQDEAAIEAFREALRHDPSNTGARVNLANKYLGMGLVGDARSLLEDVLRDAPALPEAHYALARTLETAGEGDDAARHYRLFLRLADGRFPALESRVAGHLAELEGGGL